MWLDVIPLLAPHYRVIAPDRIGHGESDPMPKSFRVSYDFDAVLARDRSPVFPYEDFLAADLAFLDALGLDQLLVVGQSTGAHLAMEIAIAQPDRVEKLVLMSNSDWTSTEQRVEIARDITKENLVRRLDGGHWLQVWRRRQRWISGRTTPEELTRATIWALKSMDTWQTLSPAVILHYDTSERVMHLRQPVLFVDGELDHEQGIHARRQRDLLPAGTPSEISVVKGAGYLYALEEPQQLAEHPLNFLGRPTAEATT
jgi:pimeloyl-ACP methyl ester carboxylesterase